MCSRLITIHNVTLWTCPNDYTPTQAPSPLSPSPLSPSPSSPSPSSPSPLSPSPLSPSPLSPLSPSPLSPSPLSSPCLEGIATTITPVYPIPTTPSSKLPVNTTIGELCQCRMDGLHILWIVPLLLLIAMVVLKCKSSGYRIANTPAALRYLVRRSHSWPIFGQSSSLELPTRAHTEPKFESIVV